jgi:hypothetical protein
MAQGEFALVRQHLQQGLDKVGWPTAWGSLGTDLDLYTMLADAAAGQGDEAAIRRYAAVAEELADRADHVLYQAISHRAWAVAHRLAGELAEAETRLERALALFGQLGTEWQLGRAWLECAALAQSRQQTEATIAYLARALLLFEQIGAAPDAERTRAAINSVAL